MFSTSMVDIISKIWIKTILKIIVALRFDNLQNTLQIFHQAYFEWTSSSFNLAFNEQISFQKKLDTTAYKSSLKTVSIKLI